MARLNDDSTKVAREPVQRNDLPPSVHPMLDHFVQQRLLVSRGDVEGQENLSVEVAHEALFRKWDRLVGWLDQGREFLLWRKRLDAAYAEWQRNGALPQDLLTGTPLAEARRWREENTTGLEVERREFIDASIQQDEHRLAQATAGNIANRFRTDDHIGADEEDALGAIAEGTQAVRTAVVERFLESNAQAARSIPHHKYVAQALLGITPEGIASG